MTDELVNFVDEYRAYVRRIGMPNADGVADDLLNSLLWIDRYGADDADALDLVDDVRRIVRSAKPWKERLDEFQKRMISRS